MAINEQWKDVKGYEGEYQISSLGNVRNIRRSIPLKPYVNENGYCIVGLYNKREGKHIHYRVHRLVADAFIANQQRKRTVNHIDGNKKNNTADNLEWATHGENLKHARAMGLIRTTEKQRLTASKNLKRNRLLSKPEKRCFFTDNEGRRVEFPSVKAAAAYVGGVSSGISLCCHQRKKTYKGYEWGYC